MKSVKVIVALAAAASLGACVISVERNAPPPPAPAAPVEAARLPIDLRRTTLIVRDMDRSLALYRDALGMEVQYDQILTSPNLGRAGSDGVNRSRLVLLRANDSFIGMLGLWQFLDGPADPPPQAPTFHAGDIVLLFNATDLEQRFPRVAAAPGVTVLGEPRPRTYPSATGDIQVMVSMLVDPDGHIVELNRLVSGGPAHRE